MCKWFFCALLCISATLNTNTSPLKQEVVQTTNIPSHHSYNYTLSEKLLRLCYFRSAVSNEYFMLNQFITVICNVLNISFWNTKTFNSISAEKTLELLKQMGAQENYSETLDKHGIVHSIILDAKDLEMRIESYGASWKKMNDGERTIFVILPPENLIPDWDSFANEALLMMGWKKQEISLPNGKKIEGIITCENADLIKEEDLYKYCFIHCHANSHSFVDDPSRMGFYLGMKQNICSYDQRGVGFSKGKPSEVAFYLDLQTVYSQLMAKHPYPAKNLWVGGFCAGGPVAAYLKTQLHDQGINFYAEQSFSDLMRDFIEPRNPLIRWLGRRSMGGLKSPDIPYNLPGRPAEYQFSIERMWEKLTHNAKGKVIIIHSLNDRILTKNVPNRFLEIAQQVNKNVFSVFYISTNLRDTHSDNFYFYSEAQRKFIEAVFQDPLQN